MTKGAERATGKGLYGFAGLLDRSARMLSRRVEVLEDRLHHHDGADEGIWKAYVEAVAALVAVLGAVTGEPTYLTTKQLADRLQVTSKTVLRRKKRGQLTPALVAGKLIRWKSGAGLGGGR